MNGHPPQRMGLGAAVIAAYALLTPATAQSPPVAPTPNAIQHGAALTAAMVGPAAAGFAATEAAGAFVIKDDTQAAALRRVEQSATYDGFKVQGPHLLIESVTFSGPLDIYARLPLVLRGVSVRVAGESYWAVLSRREAGPLLVLWSDIGGRQERGRQPWVQRGLYLESDHAVVYRGHVSRTGDGIQIHGVGARIIETLVDDLETWPGEHNDGIQVIGRGAGLTIERSRILNRHPQTSAVLLQRGGHTIADSYLSGGGWTLYGGATAKPPDIPAATLVRITGTVFGQEYSKRSGTFGPVADWRAGPDTANEWRGNRFADGRPVEPPPPTR